MHTLYLVATPIGNLEDVTLRALRVLKEVGLIAAEDTRVTRKLLDRYDIRTPLTSYHEHSRKSKLSQLLGSLADHDVALVSDAGMPAISDPGQELARQAAEAGAAVVALPGASAVTTALAVSGMPADQFVYVGFLPRKKADRVRLLQSLRSDPRPVVAFETPHRLKAALADLLDALGDRTIAVCREMTKLHEEVFRGTISEALEHFATPRGEFTLVVGGASDSGDEDQLTEADAARLLAGFRSQGLGAAHSVAQVVGLTGITRRRVYELWLGLGGDADDAAPR